ncbi:MAG: DUF4386 domain-containing protein [Candidatus Hodarchaeales archaeon]|jgi:hypothetical protein
MNSEKITARIVGVLFLLALVSVMLNGLLLGALTEPDYLAAFSATENEVLIAVLLEFTLIVSVVSIPIMMFPIFKKHNESLALGYVVARVFEGFSDFILAISWLLLVTLGRCSGKHSLLPRCSNILLFVVSIKTRSSMVISLGSYWSYIVVNKSSFKLVRL